MNWTDAALLTLAERHDLLDVLADQWQDLRDMQQQEKNTVSFGSKMTVQVNGLNNAVMSEPMD